MWVRIIVEFEADHPIPPAIKIKSALDEYEDVRVTIEEDGYTEVKEIMERTRELFS